MTFPKNFIKATKDFSTPQKPIAAPLFRKVFTVDKAAEAQIIIAACGFYKLFINGKDITKGALAPYISNPDDMVYADQYTVQLNAGKNVIGVILGNGFVNCSAGWVWQFDKAAFRSAPSFGLRLVCDGITIESDQSFKTAPSPIVFDDYRYGEQYDATKEIADWNLVDFDDSDWSNALVATAPRGEIRVCEAEPILVQRKLKPVSVKKLDQGYLYDFGENCAGVCQLNVNGAKGQRIEMRHGEMIIDGKLDVKYLWFPGNEGGVHWEIDEKFIHKDVYTCNGSGNEQYIPSFTYHGFQYVYVTGITEDQATEDLLTYLVMNSNLTACGGFSTSDKTLTALYDMTVRSTLANFYYFATDCPQREKNGWTADAALSAEHTLLKFDASTSYREWMRTVCKAQNDKGALPGIVPTGGWGFSWGNGPAWDSVLAILPYFNYKYRGDKQIIKECAPAFEKYLRYLLTRNDENGLLAIGLGDWCHVGERYTTPKAPLIVTDTIMAIDIANKMAVMFDAVQMPKQAALAREIAAQYRAAFRANLIDFDTMTVLGECQSSQAMAIYYGLFEKDEEHAAFARLVDFIHQFDDHMDVGVLGARIIFHVLSDFGQAELAYKMIARPDFPSYGYLVELGLNTLWEKFTREPMESLNHHFWGDITAWFVKAIVGIDYNPTATQLNRVDIKPHIVDALNDASAYYDSNYGKIEASWQKQGEKVMLNVTVTESMIGTIAPQNGYCFEDKSSQKPLASGKYILIKA
ncbi:MAG: family 78 glycoside hydrolase catalytic domain [Clostridia bacterium]|nr:family 78 glycoside hydrolase catalytic domain [Clostridia bacterium]